MCIYFLFKVSIFSFSQGGLQAQFEMCALGASHVTQTICVLQAKCALQYRCTDDLFNGIQKMLLCMELFEQNWISPFCDSAWIGLWTKCAHVCKTQCLHPVLWNCIDRSCNGVLKYCSEHSWMLKIDVAHVSFSALFQDHILKCIFIIERRKSKGCTHIQVLSCLLECLWPGPKADKMCD